MYVRDDDIAWSPVIPVGRWEDKTTWTLSGGQLVPPAEGSRLYANIRHVDFPVGYFTEGMWAM
jgi:hypothetical protein